ncbi:hypothetical protein KSS87_019040 [Heliosperma pusillum]|nr:hypothetical protein KSS87_019040 [Heliosperma pusillum]
MDYLIDPKHNVTEHLCVMSAMIRDLKAIGRDVPDEEKVVNVLRSLPSDTEERKNFKLLMSHSENLKTFNELAKHVEMEVERQTAFKPPTPAATLAVHNKFKNNEGKRGQKGRCHTKPNGPQDGVQKQQKAKEPIKRVNLARVKCYNCEKKGHFAQNFPEPKKIRGRAST